MLYAPRKFVVSYAFLVVCVGVFLALHLFQIGSVSPTWDEINDLKELSCYIDTTSSCRLKRDLTQSRLPFFIHLLIEHWFGPDVNPKSHYILSLLFGLLNILLVYWFSRREFGVKVASVTMLLFLSSIPLLASSRMILTHSNVIFTFFSLFAIVLFYYCVKRRMLSLVVLSGFSFGLAVGSSILGLSLVIYYFVFCLLAFRGKRLSLLFVPLVFLLIFGGIYYCTIAVESPQLISYWLKTVLTLHHHERWYYNYFDLGLPSSPWWFSTLTFAVKITPWCCLLYVIYPFLYFGFSTQDLKHRFLMSLFASTLVFLLLKSAFYTYSAPHHQLHWYPFVYLTIAVSIVEILMRLRKRAMLRSFVVAVLIVMAFLQVRDVVRFFPNYLFYGAQYSQNFIGELYGPAVLLCQDLEPLREKLKQVSQGKKTEFLVPGWFCPYRVGKLVRFHQRDREKKYRYAIYDYLYMEHLRFWEPEDYAMFLKQNCTEIYSHRFPANFKIYSLYECV